PDYQIAQFPDSLRQFPPGFQLAGGPVGQLSGIDVHLDITTLEMTSDELFRQRVFDVPLNRAAQRPGAVRSVLTRHLDDPVDHFWPEVDLQRPCAALEARLRH